MAEASSQHHWRLGVVSFLNAKPLIEGLDSDESIELIFDVPSRLPALLDQRAVDLALVPVIDLADPQRSWRIVSDSCIGCDGETLTVRVFSRVPPEDVRTLHVDGDSHTSVALARIIWPELFGAAIEIVPFAGEHPTADYEAVLLIGDKVVTNRLIGFDHQLDLGQAWKSLTSLPFVFAVWAAPKEVRDVTWIARRLSIARDAGVAGAKMIAADFGPGMGWPVTLAERYLTTRLKFGLGANQRRGMARFFELARKHDLVPAAQELIYA